MKYVFILIFGLFAFSCKNEKNLKKKEALSAQEIVDKAIAISGGNAFSNSEIAFDFRDMSYRAFRKNGQFNLERRFNNALGDTILDILSNNGFKRYTNGSNTVLGDSLAGLYSASVNSVHYFSVLPYGLNDKAVNKKLLGKERIRSQSYYKIKVTFNENGGGEDYEDVFIYWIDENTFKTDYIAYSYNEPDGKGMRFRQAYNERFIEGLRFLDYKNYKPKLREVSLLSLGEAFENNSLELLSVIELENISVKLLE